MALDPFPSRRRVNSSQRGPPKLCDGLAASSSRTSWPARLRISEMSPVPFNREIEEMDFDDEEDVQDGVPMGKQRCVLLSM